MKRCEPETIKRVCGYLRERFGIPETVFDTYTFYESSRGRVHLGPVQLPKELEIDAVGCIIARVQKTIKPSTHLFTMFGRHVTRATIELSPEQVVSYVKGSDIQAGDRQTGTVRLGFVMLTHRGRALGCGLLRQGNRIENVLPRSVRMSVELL